MHSFSSMRSTGYNQRRVSAEGFAINESPEMRQIELLHKENSPQVHEPRRYSVRSESIVSGDHTPARGLSFARSDGGSKSRKDCDLGIEVNPDQWHPSFGNPHAPFAIEPDVDVRQLNTNSIQSVATPFWWKRWPFLWGFAVAFLIAIAIIVALVVHFVVQHPTQPSLPVPKAAMNGSGVVSIDLGDGSRRIALFSQHYNGEIRKYEYLDGTWTGGSGSDLVVTSGARNGTPLMALSYAIENELIWRVFYVDANDTLQDRINSNNTQGGWTDGLLGNGEFKVSSSPHVGLSACRNYQWYGLPYNISDFGIRLYYGGADHAVHELEWTYGHQAWSTGQDFDDANGDGGVECTVNHTDPPNITYLWLLNAQGELEERWYDFNDSNRTPTHPTTTWVKGLTYPGPRQNSAITAITVDPGLVKLVHFQMANNTVRELEAHGTAENTTWSNPLDIERQSAIPNSRLGSVVLSTSNDGQEIHVFCQTNGTDITDFIRTLDGDSWSVDSVPTGPP